MSSENIRNQLSAVKQSIANLAEVIESLYTQVDALDASREREAPPDPPLETSNSVPMDPNTPLRGFTTTVSTPMFGFNQPINPRRLTSTGRANDNLCYIHIYLWNHRFLHL